jgi:hypothetical protein
VPKPLLRRGGRDRRTPEEAAQAIVCTENGVGLLDLKTLAYAWLHAVSPINDCLVADLDSDGRPEVILAKQDGYLLVYDEAGQLVRRELVGEPVRAVAAVRRPDGQVLLAAALPGRIVGFDPTFARSSVLAVGEYTRLALASQEGVLLAFGEQARIDAFEVYSTR